MGLEKIVCLLFKYLFIRTNISITYRKVKYRNIHCNNDIPAHPYSAGSLRDFWIVLNSDPCLPASQVKRARDELEGRGPDGDPQRKRPKEEKRSGQEDASSANCNRLEISDNDESIRCVDLATVR